MSRAPKTKSTAKAAALNPGMVLHAPQLAKLPWLVHGFSTRRSGVSTFANTQPSPSRKKDLNLGRVDWDSLANVRENRRRLLARLKAAKMKMVMLRQIHSDLIRVVSGPAVPGNPPAGDGLMTDRPGLLLAIFSADCFPVLLVDRRLRVVAAFHCGWRGTVRRLAQKGVGVMKQQFGSREEDLRAAIGPGIRACCYSVGKDVIEEFEGQFSYARKLFEVRRALPTPVQVKYGHLLDRIPMSSDRFNRPTTHLDLVLANVCQLREAGVEPKHIYADAPCTSCHPELFFSHRRDGGRTGRMMGVVGMRK